MMKSSEMTNDQLDAWYDNIARIDEVILPGIRREQCFGELCDILEMAGIEIREE